MALVIDPGTGRVVDTALPSGSTARVLAMLTNGQVAEVTVSTGTSSATPGAASYVDAMTRVIVQIGDTVLLPLDSMSVQATVALADALLQPVDALAVRALLSDTLSQPVEGFVATAVYTASGIWTCPTGVTTAVVACRGGGQGGAAGTSTGGTGGRGGDYAQRTSSVAAGTAYTVTVAAVSAAGGAGKDSWFRDTATVLAKGGGSSATSVGDLVYAGGAGTAGTLLGAGGVGGGSAGSAGAANGQTAGAPDGSKGAAAATNGSGLGAGGGGGAGSVTSPGAATTGAAGEVRIRWTFL